MHSGGRTAVIETNNNLSPTGTANTTINFNQGNSMSAHSKINGNGQKNPSASIAAQSGPYSSGVSANYFDTMSADVYAGLANQKTSIDANGTGALVGITTAEDSSKGKKMACFAGDFTANSTASASGYSASAAGTMPTDKIFLVTTNIPDDSSPYCCLTPYSTLQSAVDNVTGPGYTIYIDNGTYEGALIDSKDTLTLSSLPEVGAAKAILSGGDVTTPYVAKSVLYVNNSPNFTLQNLTITGGTDVGVILNNSDNATILGNTISNNGNTGMVLFGSSNSTISNNIANNNVGHGIGFFNGSNVIISGNTVNNNGEYGIEISESPN
jgi:parallel beta-helix repeat protein